MGVPTCGSLRSNASTVDTVLKNQLEILEGLNIQHAADSVQLLVSNNRLSTSRLFLLVAR